jgi:hypothetical protein
VPSSFPNLRLFLMDAAALDLRDYEVYASREVRWPAGRLTCYVIGASSIVVVETPQAAVAEVIACLDTPPSDMLAMLRIDPKPNYCAKLSVFGPHLTYGALIGTQALGGGPWLEKAELEYRFPGDPSPRTAIDWSAEDERLTVKTLHEYPEAGVVVESASYWFPA